MLISQRAIKIVKTKMIKKTFAPFDYLSINEFLLQPDDKNRLDNIEKLKSLPFSSAFESKELELLVSFDSWLLGDLA